MAVRLPALTLIRHQLADALTGMWPVHPSPVDAVDGPCLVILSGTRDPMAFGCNYTTRPVVLCVAGRVEPGPAAEVLDDQEEWVLSRLPWALERVDAEMDMTFGNVTYLARRIVTRTTVTIGGGA